MDKENNNKNIVRKKERTISDTLGNKGMSYFFADDETSGRTDELNEMLQNKKTKLVIIAGYVILMTVILGIVAGIIILNSK